MDAAISGTSGETEVIVCAPDTKYVLMLVLFATLEWSDAVVVTRNTVIDNKAYQAGQLMHRVKGLPFEDWNWAALYEGSSASCL